MKIALVHDWLAGLGGSEQVLLTLQEIFPSSPIFTSVYNQKALPQFKNAKIITSFLNKLPFARKRPQYYLPFLPHVFENFDFSDFDLVISNCHSVSKGVVTKPETLHICYCLTPIRYIWLPWLDPRLSNSLFKRILAHKLRIWDFQAAQRVNRFIGISETVAQRIEKYYRKEADVIFPPVRTSFFKPLYSLNQLGNYFLMVGRLVDYKRPDIVIEAFNQLGLPLKVIGSGPILSALKKIARKNIEFLGKVSDEKLKEYYAKALAFIFPTEEDFGIVAVEAMASGRPVIAYKRGAMTEIVKEGISGAFFNEQTAESLKKVVENFKPEKYEPKQIRNEAMKFDEEVFKKKFLEYTEREISKFKSQIPNKF